MFKRCVDVLDEGAVQRVAMKSGGSAEHVGFCSTWARKLAVLRLYFIDRLGREI